MTQIQNIIKNKKNNSNIKYAFEDLERNENDTMKMFEAVKKTKRLAPKKNGLSKQKMDLHQTKKAVRNHSKILRTCFLFECNTNTEGITSTDVNTIHIIRNKKCSMNSKNDKAPE